MNDLEGRTELDEHVVDTCDQEMRGEVPQATPRRKMHHNLSRNALTVFKLGSNVGTAKYHVQNTCTVMRSFCSQGNAYLV